MSNRQTTSSLLMVRPSSFGFNEETAANNYYQALIPGKSDNELQKMALVEFENLVSALRKKKVEVIVIEDMPSPKMPDSIFPNNWLSLHSDGRVALYPMFAESRRLERREDILLSLQDSGFMINEKVDFSSYESQNLFLEGTGSMVLDRAGKIAYAAISERTSVEVLNDFCSKFGYTPIVFHAFQTVDSKRVQIYHTNVMMSIGNSLAVICFDSIDDIVELNLVKENLRNSSRYIITINEDQVAHFAGNVLEVENQDGDHYLVMSSSAYYSLTGSQVSSIEQRLPIIHSDLNTIETLGGGSARCMIAEVFLNKTVKHG